MNKAGEPVGDNGAAPPEGSGDARVATKPAQDRSPPPAIESVGLSDPLAATLKSPP